MGTDRERDGDDTISSHRTEPVKDFRSSWQPQKKSVDNADSFGFEKLVRRRAVLPNRAVPASGVVK